MASEKGSLVPAERKVGDSTSSALTETKQIRSIADLFSISVGDNTSALKHDINADGWPDIGDMNDPLITEAMDTFQDEIDIFDVRSVVSFGDRALRDIEGVYSRFNQNSILSMGQMEEEKSRSSVAKLSMNLTEMLEQLRPFFVTEEELKPGFFSRLFGAKAEAKPTPEQILTSIEIFGLDLNAHQAEVARTRQNATRTIRSIRAQKSALENTLADAKKAEIRLFIAYYAGMEVFKEWHSDPVKNAYINVSEFSNVPEAKKPETEFFIPNSPADWHDFTFNMNQRLEHLRNVYRKFQKMQTDIPKFMAAVDMRIENFEKTVEGSQAGWDKSVGKIRTALELIRTEQRIERLKDQAQDAQKRIKGHEKYMTDFEKSTIATDDKFKETAERIRDASVVFLEEQSEQSAKLSEKLQALSEVRNALRVQLGERPIERQAAVALPDALTQPAEKPKSRWNVFSKK